MLMSESGILWREVSDGYQPNASYLLYSVLTDADEREWEFVERGEWWVPACLCLMPVVSYAVS